MKIPSTIPKLFYIRNFFIILFQTVHHIQVHEYMFPEQSVNVSECNLQSLDCDHRLQTSLLDIPSRQFLFPVFFSSHIILEFQILLLYLLKEFSIFFIPLCTRTKTKEFFTICTWTNQFTTTSTTFKITQISHSPFAQFAQSIVSLILPS